MLQLVDVDMNVLCEPIKLFLDKLTAKHLKIEYCLTVSAKQDANNPDHWTLLFRDPRFTAEEVGAVASVAWTYGSRNDKEYVTKSRLIENERFHQWNRDEYRAKRTKDVNKAVKHTLEFAKPFAWAELVADDMEKAKRSVVKWKDENDSLAWRFRPNAEELVEEIEHLIKLNVPVKTEAFKKMVELLPEWHEHQRRKTIPAKFDSVFIREDKVIYMPIGAPEVELTSTDALPEKHRNAIALLKLMGDEELIPEVGYKGKHQKYFVAV